MDYKMILTNAVRNIFYLALGIVVGITWMKSKQNEGNADRLKTDSALVRPVAIETEELKNEIDKWLENNDPVLPDGSPNPEWLQLLEHQRSIAKQRSDQSSVLSRISILR